MTENKRFHWDWQTGRMKDTYSNFQATKDMRLIERSINDACRNYEKQITELKEENKQLKQALLFFLDVANAECSSNFKKDMEHDCQKLFNCSYDEAKKKYGGYKYTNKEYENLDTIDNQLFCDLYFNQVGGI